MDTIIVTMIDTKTNKIVERRIDISNFYVPYQECWKVTTDENEQREMLNDWIKDRANDQHDTILKLSDWKII